MKKLVFATSLVLGWLDAHAATCMVQQADPNSSKRFRHSVELIIKQDEKDVEVVISLPSVRDELPLTEVSLVIMSEQNENYEFFIPVATNPSADGKSNKSLLILTKDIFNRADIVVNYGQCALEYKLDLQEIEPAPDYGQRHK